MRLRPARGMWNTRHANPRLPLASIIAASVRIAALDSHLGQKGFINLLLQLAAAGGCATAQATRRLPQRAIERQSAQER